MRPKKRTVNDSAETPWYRYLQVGDVLRAPSGDLRVVRGVSHFAPKRCSLHGATAVTLVIRRCSWTKKPITVLFGADLNSRGYVPVSVRPRRLNAPLDKAIAEWLQRPEETSPLRCCDVRGLP